MTFLLEKSDNFNRKIKIFDENQSFLFENMSYRFYKRYCDYEVESFRCFGRKLGNFRAKTVIIRVHLNIFFSVSMYFQRAPTSCLSF